MTIPVSVLYHPWRLRFAMRSNSKMFMHGLVSGCAAFTIGFLVFAGLSAGGAHPLWGVIVSLPLSLTGAWAVHRLTVNTGRMVL